MRHHVSVSARILAAPERVYSILADYRDGHPRILPPQFSGLKVERGGHGAGTTISFQIHFMGRVQNYRAEISEPEPERRLVETYLEPPGTVTTFLVERGPGREETAVTITTAFDGRNGLLGKFERWMAGRVLKPIFEKELKNLAAVARGA